MPSVTGNNAKSTQHFSSHLSLLLLSNRNKDNMCHMSILSRGWSLVRNVPEECIRASDMTFVGPLALAAAGDLSHNKADLSVFVTMANVAKICATRVDVW